MNLTLIRHMQWTTAALLLLFAAISPERAAADFFDATKTDADSAMALSELYAMGGDDKAVADELKGYGSDINTLKVIYYSIRGNPQDRIDATKTILDMLATAQSSDKLSSWAKMGAAAASSMYYASEGDSANAAGKRNEFLLYLAGGIAAEMAGEPFGVGVKAADKVIKINKGFEILDLKKVGLPKSLLQQFHEVVSAFRGSDVTGLGDDDLAGADADASPGFSGLGKVGVSRQEADDILSDVKQFRSGITGSNGGDDTGLPDPGTSQSLSGNVFDNTVDPGSGGGQPPVGSQPAPQGDPGGDQPGANNGTDTGDREQPGSTNQQPAQDASTAQQPSQDSDGSFRLASVGDNSAGPSSTEDNVYNMGGVQPQRDPATGDYLWGDGSGGGRDPNDRKLYIRTPPRVRPGDQVDNLIAGLPVGLPADIGAGRGGAVPSGGSGAPLTSLNPSAPSGGHVPSGGCPPCAYDRWSYVSGISGPGMSGGHWVHEWGDMNSGSHTANSNTPPPTGASLANGGTYQGSPSASGRTASTGGGGSNGGGAGGSTSHGPTTGGGCGGAPCEVSPLVRRGTQLSASGHTGRPAFLRGHSTRVASLGYGSVHSGTASFTFTRPGGSTVTTQHSVSTTVMRPVFHSPTVTISVPVTNTPAPHIQPIAPSVHVSTITTVRTPVVRTPTIRTPTVAVRAPTVTVRVPTVRAPTVRINVPTVRVPTVSDIRLKQDIVELGVMRNGLHLYRYRYIGQSARYVGVMAQEVAMKYPAAVIAGEDGYLRVDYGQLGLRLMSWREWSMRNARPESTGPIGY